MNAAALYDFFILEIRDKVVGLFGRAFLTLSSSAMLHFGDTHIIPSCHRKSKILPSNTSTFSVADFDA
jgi:hypothetical protein